MTDLWLFLLALLTVLGAPGPTNTLLAAAGAAAGLRRALPLLAAELAGYLASIGLIRAILVPVLASAPLLLVGLKVAVAAYLVWIAIDVWRRTLRLEGAGTVGALQVFIATLLNPKAVIIALTIFPPAPFAPPVHTAVFVAVTGLTGLGWIALGRLLSTAAGAGGARIIPRAGAIALGGFAGLILYSAFG